MILTVAGEQLLNALDKLVPVAECRDADLLEVLVAHLGQDVHRDLLPIKHLHKTMLLIAGLDNGGEGGGALVALGAGAVGCLFNS